MDFTADFVEEFENKQQDIEELFSEEESPDKGSTVRNHWHDLPDCTPENDVSKYAVDGSRMTRQFSNGSELLICRALMIGGDGETSEEYKEMFVDAYRGPGNPDLTQRYARLISHLVEIEVILNNWSEIPEGSVVYIDGSIYGRYLHSLWPFRLQDREDVPLQLLRRHMELINKAEEKSVLLIGVSKTSQVRALAKQIGVDMPDAELLYKHTSSPGYTTPIVLGGYGFDSDEYEWLETNPERFAERIFTQTLSKDKALSTIRQLKESPAIATFHIRTEPNHETMRIDIPVNALDREETITSYKSELIEPATVESVCGHVLEDYGGMKVYNSLLYTVDKLVRLNRETVDNVYLDILKDETGTDIELTRSYRRFM